MEEKYVFSNICIVDGIIIRTIQWCMFKVDEIGYVSIPLVGGGLNQS